MFNHERSFSSQLVGMRQLTPPSMYATSTSLRPRFGFGVRFHRESTCMPAPPWGPLDVPDTSCGTQPNRYHDSLSHVAPPCPRSPRPYPGSLASPPAACPLH